MNIVQEVINEHYTRGMTSKAIPKFLILSPNTYLKFKKQLNDNTVYRIEHGKDCETFMGMAVCVLPSYIGYEPYVEVA